MSTEFQSPRAISPLFVTTRSRSGATTASSRTTALVRSGVPFFAEQQNVVFANAHNELLEVAAETGWPGLAAFVFGLVLLARRLRRWHGTPAALAWAGVTAVAVVSSANFPFRIGIALWPICLFLAWIFSGDEGGEEGARGAAADAGGKA